MNRIAIALIISLIGFPVAARSFGLVTTGEVVNRDRVHDSGSALLLGEVQHESVDPDEMVGPPRPDPEITGAMMDPNYVKYELIDQATVPLVQQP